MAISRVKALDGLMFESPFDYSRFTSQDSPIARDRELDIIKALNGYSTEILRTVIDYNRP